MDIAVLNYSTGEVFIYRNIETNDVESFLEEKGFNFDEIYYMMNLNHINVYESNN